MRCLPSAGARSTLIPRSKQIPKGTHAHLREAREDSFMTPKERDPGVTVQPIAPHDEAAFVGLAVRELDSHTVLVLFEVHDLMAEVHWNPAFLRSLDQGSEKDRPSRALNAMAENPG